MNLEIDDYLKTIENLNEKLQKSQSKCEDLEQSASKAAEQQATLENEIGTSCFVFFILNPFVNNFVRKMVTQSWKTFGEITNCFL